MSRKARKTSCTGVYHVVIRGMDRQRLFEDDKDYYKYLDLLAAYKKKCDFKVFAYCLMGNHVHLLLYCTTMPIGEIMHFVSTKYACWFNEKYERVGHLQQDRFYSEVVETEEYFCAAFRYIHHNPLKAKLENAVGESYKWSSFREYRGDFSLVVDPTQAIRIFGSRERILNYLKQESTIECLDIDRHGTRISDEAARQIITKASGYKDARNLANACATDRERLVQEVYTKGLTISQINRLTGITRGVLRRILGK